MTEQHTLPASLTGFRVHLVGIKGTGMAALAEVLSSRGARVSGSDTSEIFYTDAVLRKLAIPFTEGFDAGNIPADIQLVVHSAAYKREENPELVAAATRGIPTMQYPEALGALSRGTDSSGICGVHGKSTTTALCGLILKAWGFPATVLVGAEVPDFGSRSTLVLGSRYFVAETCEYRRHFLNFSPSQVVMTSIEPDHLDYFRDMDDILDAFVEYGMRIADGGSLVYCADDAGAAAAAGRIAAKRPDVRVIPYGRTAEGVWRIVAETAGGGEAPSPWREPPSRSSCTSPGPTTCSTPPLPWRSAASSGTARGEPRRPDLAAAAAALGAFRGSRRRSEMVGEAGGVLIIDDYAHHPTAVRTTLEGIRRFYPGRRILVDFMSHTYSRTRALLGEFGACFAAADVVLLHRIYASARERNESGITGRDLYRGDEPPPPECPLFRRPPRCAPVSPVGAPPWRYLRNHGSR